MNSRYKGPISLVLWHIVNSTFVVICQSGQSYVNLMSYKVSVDKCYLIL